MSMPPHRSVPSPKVPPVSLEQPPKETTYIRMRDVLRAIYGNENFAQLFEVRGHPTKFAPWRWALVTMMRFAEGLLGLHWSRVLDSLDEFRS